MNPEVSRITVGCSTGPGKLHHFWQSTGFTPANLLTNVIRTYEVQRATAVDGPYQRINVKDQLDTAFLHVRDGERASDGERALYRVLAVDYWGGTGEPSDPIELE